MVEWVGVLIGAVGVLFGRIERREDRLQQRTDLLKPLLELYHRVSEWERFAKATNSKLTAWFHARTPEERSTAASQVLFACSVQYVRVVDGGRWIYGDVDADENIEHHDKIELRDLIAIYAPDLEDKFGRVMSLRGGQLRSLQGLVRKEAHEDGLIFAFQELVDNQPLSAIPINEQFLRDFERSGNQLS